MRKKLSVMLVTAVMLAMAASPAVAAPGKNGQGALHASPKASFGIANAIAHSGGGGCGGACE